MPPSTHPLISSCAHYLLDDASCSERPSEEASSWWATSFSIVARSGSPSAPRHAAKVVAKGCQRLPQTELEDGDPNAPLGDASTTITGLPHAELEDGAPKTALGDAPPPITGLPHAEL